MRPIWDTWFDGVRPIEALASFILQGMFSMPFAEIHRATQSEARVEQGVEGFLIEIFNLPTRPQQ